MSVSPKMYSLFQQQGNRFVRVSKAFYSRSKANQIFAKLIESAEEKRAPPLIVRRAYKNESVFRLR